MQANGFLRVNMQSLKNHDRNCPERTGGNFPCHTAVHPCRFRGRVCNCSWGSSGICGISAKASGIDSASSELYCFRVRHATSCTASRRGKVSRGIAIINQSSLSAAMLAASPSATLAAGHPPPGTRYAPHATLVHAPVRAAMASSRSRSARRSTCRSSLAIRQASRPRSRA